MAGTAIKRAKKLVDLGKIEEARDILLAAGFVSGEDATVQREFVKLIPPSEALAEHRDVLARVSARTPAARYKALHAIAREVYKETSTYLKSWLADPRTTDVLIAAAADPDPKVAQEAACVLYIVLDRYFADRRAFQPLAALLHSKQKQTRLYAVFAIAALDHPDRWNVLLPAFEDRSVDVRKAACRAVVFNYRPGQASKGTLATLKQLVDERLSDPVAPVRSMAANARQQLGA
jgi:HEAT repeat protein